MGGLRPGSGWSGMKGTMMTEVCAHLLELRLPVRSSQDQDLEGTGLVLRQSSENVVARDHGCVGCQRTRANTPVHTCTMVASTHVARWPIHWLMKVFTDSLMYSFIYSFIHLSTHVVFLTLYPVDPLPFNLQGP